MTCVSRKHMKNKFNPGDLVELTYNHKRLALVLSYSHTRTEGGDGKTWEETGQVVKVYKIYVFDKKIGGLYKEWAMRKIS